MNTADHFETMQVLNSFIQEINVLKVKFAHNKLSNEEKTRIAILLKVVSVFNKLKTKPNLTVDDVISNTANNVQSASVLKLINNPETKAEEVKQKENKENDLPKFGEGFEVQQNVTKDENKDDNKEDSNISILDIENEHMEVLSDDEEVKKTNDNNLINYKKVLGSKLIVEVLDEKELVESEIIEGLDINDDDKIFAFDQDVKPEIKPKLEPIKPVVVEKKEDKPVVIEQKEDNEDIYDLINNPPKYQPESEEDLTSRLVKLTDDSTESKIGKIVESYNRPVNIYNQTYGRFHVSDVEENANKNNNRTSPDVNAELFWAMP
jgi:hypothetical protein